VEAKEAMQTTLDIERDVKNFVIDQFLAGNASKLRSDGSLLGDVIDSMGVIALVGYLQEHFGITVEDDEVLPSNLDTINSLVAYVSTKLGA
jgi:acyl carrier protein